ASAPRRSRPSCALQTRGRRRPPGGGVRREQLLGPSVDGAALDDLGTPLGPVVAPRIRGPFAATPRARGGIGRAVRCARRPGRTRTRAARSPHAVATPYPARPPLAG